MKKKTLLELELAIKKLNVLEGLVKELDQLIKSKNEYRFKNKSALNPVTNEKVLD